MSRKRSAFRRIFESESEPQRHVVLVRKARLSSPANHVILRTSPSCPGQAPGIFVIATIAESQRPVLAALKMGDGPYYTFVRRYHLCALEIPNTIRRAMEGQPPLWHNSAAPTIGVAAVAKRSLRPGEHIDTGIGSFQMRGTAVRFRDEPSHLPIGLLYGATVTRPVEPDQMLSLDDVDLPDSYARDITLELIRDARG